jgi:hypothetical protein
MNDDDQPSGPPMAQQVPETFTQSDSLELQNLNNGEGQARKALYDQEIDQNAYNDLMGQIHQRRAPLIARQQQAQQASQQQQLQQAMHSNAMQQAMAHSDAKFRADGFNDRVSVYTDPLTGKRAHVAEMKPGQFEQLDMGGDEGDQSTAPSQYGNEGGSTGNVASSGGDQPLDYLSPTIGMVPHEGQQVTIQNGKVTPYNDSGPGAIVRNPGAMQQAEKVYADPSQIGDNGVTKVNMPQSAQQPGSNTHAAEAMELAKEGRKVAASLGLKGAALDHAAAQFTDHFIRQNETAKENKGKQAAAATKQQEHDATINQKKQEKAEADKKAAEEKLVEHRKEHYDKGIDKELDRMHKEEHDWNRMDNLTPDQKAAKAAAKKDYFGDADKMAAEAHKRVTASTAQRDKHFGQPATDASSAGNNTGQSQAAPSQAKEAEPQKAAPPEPTDKDMHEEFKSIGQRIAAKPEIASHEDLNRLHELLAHPKEIGVDPELAARKRDGIAALLAGRSKKPVPRTEPVKGAPAPLPGYRFTP